jgi:hypothetical protein
MLRAIAGVGGVRKFMTKSPTAAESQFAVDTLSNLASELAHTILCSSESSETDLGTLGTTKQKVQNFKFPFLLPGCKIGKIESRGDLFTHMNDPPTLGDWKDH